MQVMPGYHSLSGLHVSGTRNRRTISLIPELQATAAIVRWRTSHCLGFIRWTLLRTQYEPSSTPLTKPFIVSKIFSVCTFPHLLDSRIIPNVPPRGLLILNGYPQSLPL